MARWWSGLFVCMFILIEKDLKIIFSDPTNPMNLSRKSIMSRKLQSNIGGGKFALVDFSSESSVVGSVVVETVWSSVASQVDLFAVTNIGFFLHLLLGSRILSKRRLVVLFGLSKSSSISIDKLNTSLETLCMLASLDFFFEFYG